MRPLKFRVLAKWIPGYGGGGKIAVAEQKYWMELVGMKGGPVRAPCIEMTAEAKVEMKADLAATGLLDKAAAGRKAKRAA